MRPLLKWLFVACSLLTFFSPPARAQNNVDTPCVAPAESGYFPQRDPGNKSVIVFVHGVMGDAVSTWQHKPSALNWWGTETFWPCLIRDEPLFAGANLYLYGYRSAKLGYSPKIGEAADQLFQDLEADGVLSHGHITFVAHSMGGLIVSRMLLSHLNRPDVLDRVRLVMFYGTPGLGASIASVGKALSWNDQFWDMSETDALDQWRQRWMSTFKNTPHVCAAEMSRMSWLTGVIVPAESASALCGGTFTPLYGLNHADIVKPQSRQDEPFRVLRRSYNLCVAPLLHNPAALSEAHTPLGQTLLEWFYDLQQASAPGNTSGTDISATIKMRLYLRPGKMSDRFVAPRNHAHTLAPADHDILDANSISLFARDRLLPTLPAQQVEAVIALKQLDTYTRDSLAADLRDAMLANGTLAPNDRVLVLRPAPSADSAADTPRTLLFVSDDATAQNPLGRLKGWARLPPLASSCR